MLYLIELSIDKVRGFTSVFVSEGGALFEAQNISI